MTDVNNFASAAYYASVNHMFVVHIAQISNYLTLYLSKILLYSSKRYQISTYIMLLPIL